MNFLKKNLNKLPVIIFVLAFILLFFSNIYAETTNLFSGVDGNWKYSVKFMSGQGQSLGKDVFFTYGPLAQFLLPAPTSFYSVFLNLLPGIFKLIILLIIFFLIYKLTKFNFKSLILILPLLILFFEGIFSNFIDLFFQIIALLLVFSVDQESAKFSKKEIVFTSALASVVLLFKFSSGITIFGTIFLLLLFNQYENRKQLVANLAIFSMASIFCVEFIFFLITKSVNIVPFIINSLYLSNFYKEFMATTRQTEFVYILNLILIFGLFLNFSVLKKRSFLPYAFVSYIAVSYGWIRNDGHVLATNLFVLMALLLFVYLIFKQKNKFVFQLNFINIRLALAIILIPISLYTINHLGIDILKFHINFNFFKNPIWNVEDAYAETTKELEKMNMQIPELIKNYIQKDTKCLMIIPDKSAIPLALNKCQIHQINLQLYSNYTPNSDKQNIEILSKNYPNSRILIHSGVIDNRIFLSETPLFIMNIYKNFKVALFENGYLLLEPKNQKWKKLNCLASSLNEYNFIRVDVDESILYKIESLLFKGPEICLNFEDTNSKKKRTFLSQLKNGLIVNPFISNVDGLYAYFQGNQKQIDNFKITECSDKKSFFDTRIDYLKCDFNE